MQHQEIVSWLRETNPSRLSDLWRMADDVRQRHVGGDVHSHGLIQFSNHCVRLCAYCGLRAPNTDLARYRLSADEIMTCAGQAKDFGYRLVILQSGQDPGVATEWTADVIRRIKQETPLEVMLSLGERGDQDLAAWRRVGADRYLLRFETSIRAPHDQPHSPCPGDSRHRIAMLDRIRQLGYRVGSGVMIGTPSQTYDDLAGAIALFPKLQLDLIHCGLFQVQANTPPGDADLRAIAPEEEQVPPSELISYKVVALSRLACPEASITTSTPASRSTDTIEDQALVRGANVILPHLTPAKYRMLYELHADSDCVRQTVGGYQACLARRLPATGRAADADADAG